MEQWVANARVDFEGLVADLPRDAEEASWANDPWRQIPITWRCAFLAFRGAHAFLVFFAMPLFFGGGALLALGMLFGSPPKVLALHTVVLISGSAVVLWTQHRDLCGSWRTYLQTRFDTTKRSGARSPGGPQASICTAKPPMLLSAVLWGAIGIGVLMDHEILTRWSWEYRPQYNDSYVAPVNDSCDSIVTAAELRRRVTTLRGNVFQQQYAGSVYLVGGEDSAPATDKTANHEYNYSTMIRGVVTAVVFSAFAVAWLVKWLDKRRW